jgi:hypothetical protein
MVRWKKEKCLKEQIGDWSSSSAIMRELGTGNN